MKTEFSDGRIQIKPLLPDDVTLHFEAAHESRGEMFPWMPWCHADYSIEESATWISSREVEWERKEDYCFAILECATQRFLGGCGINFINHFHQFANLGYWVRSSEIKTGIATRAVKLISQFAFEEIGLKRLEIVVAIGNNASARVAEKAGAKKEGILRNRLLLYGESHDATMFSLIATDVQRAK